MLTHETMLGLQRMSNRDMLILPETSDDFMANMIRYVEMTPSDQAAAQIEARESLAMAYGYDEGEPTTRKPFVYSDGVAVIPIHGTLLNRFAGSWGVVTGYQFIRRQMNAALDDDDVEQIVFDVDSPGGEASGCFELAREILASRRVKPSLAMVDSICASGGMALAGAATSVYAIPSARIGSIGVYRQHISVAKAMEMQGVEITFATAGKHKVDGNRFEKMSAETLKEWQQDAGRTWDDFIELVSDCRGISQAAVRDTEARVYRADEALALGLINAVKTTTEAVSSFAAEIADGFPNHDAEDNEVMADKTTEVTSEAIAAMVSSGIATQMAAIRSRRNAIVNAPEAKGKEKLAAHFADNTDMSADDAKAALAVAAVESVATGDLPLKGKKGKKAKVEAVDDEDDDDDDDAADADDETDGDDDEDEADDEEKARAARKGNKVRNRQPRDNVNHLDAAMSRTRQPNAGGGAGKKGSGGDGGFASTDDETQALLGAHAATTGASWSGKALKTA